MNSFHVEERRTVRGTSPGPSCKDGNAWFTTVALMSDQVYIRYQWYFFYNRLFSIVVSPQKWRAEYLLQESIYTGIIVKSRKTLIPSILLIR